MQWARLSEKWETRFVLKAQNISRINSARFKARIADLLLILVGPIIILVDPTFCSVKA